MSISTDKSVYNAGEEVKAEVSFSFGKPVKARRLVVSLVGREIKRVEVRMIEDHYDLQREKEMGVPRSDSIRVSTSEESREWFKQEKQAAGEGEFLDQRVQVSFTLPPNAPPTSHEFGHDNLIHVWKIEAKLDIPFAFDQNADTEIEVAGLGD